MDTLLLRSQILHFVADPAQGLDRSYQYFDDGLLLVQNGRIAFVGDATTHLHRFANQPVEHLPNRLLIPGFIDTHTHYPQAEMIAAYGDQLLNWLNHYTFPTECQFSDADYARKTARIFLDELLRNGTTTALVFGTVHTQSVDAFFNEAQARGLRMIAGKVMMDRNAPVALLDTAESAYRDSKALIERWHGVERLSYAVSPRFAPTSTDAQLREAGALLAQYPDVYLHTHLAENKDECDWVKALFPDCDSYLDVYERAGLLGNHSVFAHAIHLSDDECQQLAAAECAVAHCPTSNLFLGSGLLNLKRMHAHGIKVGLGTDIGAGSSFSMFRTMDEAYKIQQLRGATLNPFQAFYMATLGGAVALNLQDKIGNFKTGKEADFQVLDLGATPLLRYRLAFCQNLQDVLFALSTLGDDRVIERVYAFGKEVHSR